VPENVDPSTEEAVEDSTGEPGEDSGAKPGEETPKDERKYSQSELDSYVSKAVERAIERKEKFYQDKLEAEKAKLEEERLQEQGKWQEVAEAKEKELSRLKAEQKERDFVEQCRSAVTEGGYNGLTEIALKFRSVQTPEDFRSAVQALSEFDEARNSREIERRLDTGNRPTEKSGIPATGIKPISKMSDKEKHQFIEEHGVEAYKEAQYRELSVV